MIDLVRKMWLPLALRGGVGILFGVLAIAWPGVTLEALVLAAGLYAIVDGVLTMIAAGDRYTHGEPWTLSVAEALIDLVFGVFVLVAPVEAAATLWYVVAGWAFVSGLLGIIAGVAASYPLGGALLAEAGIAGMLLALWMIVWPIMAAHVLAWMIGLYAIGSGALLLALALQLHRTAHPRMRHAT